MRELVENPFFIILVITFYVTHCNITHFDSKGRVI